MCTGTVHVFLTLSALSAVDHCYLGVLIPILLSNVTQFVLVRAGTLIYFHHAYKIKKFHDQRQASNTAQSSPKTRVAAHHDHYAAFRLACHIATLIVIFVQLRKHHLLQREGQAVSSLKPIN